MRRQSAAPRGPPAPRLQGCLRFKSSHRLCSLKASGREPRPPVRGQTRAEPDIGHAAEWMQQLHQDRALGRTLGAAGRAAIERDFSPAAIGARYRRRLESIAGW